jgi:uridine phosphorylase
MTAPGVIVIAGGGDGARLERELDAAANGARIILSSGLAGALSQALVPGDLVLDGPVALVAALREALPHAHVGAVVGSDVPLATVAAKAAAGRDGALAVDMESHIARLVAARHGLPCLVARVISDGAAHALPPAALAGMRPDGGIAPGAVLASLLRNPAQLPALIRTARDAGVAFRVLGRLHHVLAGGRIGGLDLRQFALDVG